MIKFLKQITFFLITLSFTCCDDLLDNHYSSNSHHIQDEKLIEAISKYQNENILNSKIRDKVLMITPITVFPNVAFEFQPIEHTSSLDKSYQYFLVNVQNMPVLFESFYTPSEPNRTSFISIDIDTSIIKTALQPYFINQPIIPNTGYTADTWYVIFRDNDYEIINISDSSRVYRTKERIHLYSDNKLFPCLN